MTSRKSHTAKFALLIITALTFATAGSFSWATEPEPQSNQAALSLSGMFANNMVLQQKTDAAIWGQAEPNSDVVLQASWDKVDVTTKADEKGNWKTKLKTPLTLPARKPPAGDSILVSSEKVKTPVAVRYAFGNADEPHSMNKEGLPSSSFRTDDWKIKAMLAPKPKRAKQPAAGKKAKSNSKANWKANWKAKSKSKTSENMAPKNENGKAMASSQEVGSTYKPEKLPNIVFMISDELAYYELSHMGNKKIHSPNIDQMAREGVRFTQALAAAPVCGPLRCCLMTGKHMGHASMRTNGGGTPIRAEEPTIASMLKSRGYATGGFGKWGIGGRGSTGVPEKHGFDVFFGYYDQVHAHSFYTPHLIRNSEEVRLPGNSGGRKGETYSHYEIMKEGLQFIRDNKDKPFFCYLPVTPPHGMYDIPADDPAFDSYKDDEWMQDADVPQDAKNYAAMITMIDRDLKSVLDLLKELSLDENTICLLYTSPSPRDLSTSRMPSSA